MGILWHRNWKQDEEFNLFVVNFVENLPENPIFNHVNQKNNFYKKNPLFSGEPELICFHIRQKKILILFG